MSLSPSSAPLIKTGCTSVVAAGKQDLPAVTARVGSDAPACESRVQVALPITFGAPQVAVPVSNVAPEANMSPKARKVSLPAAFSMGSIG